MTNAELLSQQPPAARDHVCSALLPSSCSDLTISINISARNINGSRTLSKVVLDISDLSLEINHKASTSSVNFLCCAIYGLSRKVLSSPPLSFINASHETSNNNQLKAYDYANISFHISLFNTLKTLFFLTFEWTIVHCCVPLWDVPLYVIICQMKISINLFTHMSRLDLVSA